MNGVPQRPIFVVDDSDEDIFLFKRLLLKAGVAHPCQSAIGAGMARALLSAAVKSSFDLEHPVACFLDIKMPGENGFDVLRWIRSQPAFDRLPAIMLSTSNFEPDVQQATELGAQCYLTKFPATITLAAVITDALSYPGDPLAFRRPYNLLRNGTHSSDTKP